MGCFFPKNKSKFAQAEHRQNGSKPDYMSSNKPVVLPDPHYVAGEQPARASPGRHGVEKGGKGGNNSISPTRSGSNSASRLIGQFPRALSAPHDYSFEDPSTISNGNVNGGSSAGASAGFSAPLPSFPSPMDVTSSTPSNSAPLSLGSSPLGCGVTPTINTADSRNWSERRLSFNDRMEKKSSFGGRPIRLPKPQSGGHPLPLPYSPDRSEAGGSFAHASPIGASPSTSIGREGYGGYNHAYKVLSLGGHNPMDAMPLPPPALPTESRTPVRGFSFSELSQTFSPEFMLGDGVSGTAYRAWVDDGENRKIEVAVVCPASKSLQGQKEWMAEVNWLARLQDPHLCKLIGYCSEDATTQDGEVKLRGTRRLLVYEYLCNGTLDKYLMGKAGRQLEWSTRMRIALDIAQGLAYLHNKAPFQVICRDLCPATIQLDKDFRAKLFGLGFARCGPEGDQVSPMAGAYAAPESGQNGVVTLKSNTWSFGVVLLELLTGRRHMDPINAKEQQNLVQLTKPFLRDECKLFLIVDPELNGRYSGRGAIKLANLIFQCLHKEASLRPNLSEAVDVLRGVQVDEDAIPGDLKKSRSLSQSMTSPVSYSRSTSDISLRHNGEGKNSGEIKQRERELQKMAAGSVGSSSPSRSEPRQSRDPKPREFQRIGVGSGAAHSEHTGQSNDLKQPEREAQRLPAPAQALEPRQTQKVGIQHGPLNGRKKQLRDSQQLERELRKLAGQVTTVPGGSRLASIFNMENHKAQKLPTPQSVESTQPVDIKQHGEEAQKLPSEPQLLESIEIIEKKAPAPEAETTPIPTGPLEESHQFSELQVEPELLSPLETPSLPTVEKVEITGSPEIPTLPEESVSSNEVKQQMLEAQKLARTLAGSRASCAPALTFDPPMLREAF